MNDTPPHEDKASASKTDHPSDMPPVNHLAIIMDGNGRWAKQRGLSRSDGHKAGTEAARKIIEECLHRGIPHLTLYTFSTENWKRPVDEVRYLFSLLVDYVNNELPGLAKKGVCLNILGEIADLPFATRKALEIARHSTRNCTKLKLNLALNYSGREELARACRLCIQQGYDASAITPEILEQHLYTSGQPDPDLVIRTSGEIRLSNFLLFQTAYSELYFTDVYWPDFSSQELDKALAAYARRDRRYGAVTPTGEKA